MPNWAYNTLTVRGTKEELEEFDRKFKGHYPRYGGEQTPPDEPEDYTFSAFVPVPAEVLAKEYSPTYGANRTFGETMTEVCGYNWQVWNWGTKWDVRMSEVEKSEEEYTYRFDTAWDWPAEWLKRTTILFPHLVFEIASTEESGAFNFTATAQDGSIFDIVDLPFEEEEFDIEDVGAVGTE